MWCVGRGEEMKLAHMVVAGGLALVGVVLGTGVYNVGQT